MLRPEHQQLKSEQTHIISRSSYLCILASLLYASRKNVDLCRNILIFLKLLLETEIIRIDYIIIKTGLFQVLINLLKFLSENLSSSNPIELNNNVKNTTLKEPPVITSLKNVMCVICRLLLKLNENQDVDLFGYMANAMLNLCYSSNSNPEFNDLNTNIKSIFLKITNSINDDLNLMYSNMNDAPKSGTALLKKFIQPLILASTTSANSNSNSATTNADSSNSSSGLFDSDIVFQKFLTFIVDFIFIVYDKISDSQMDDTTYDLNDELSISAFTILAECLAISLENNQRAKFTNLFRNNLNLIRYQVFIF